ncbi:TlpA family protein disulfide reductase [Silvibacterium sp.]|uniref:TlpA family protein disulfide reductase n=1 Tax=Silvibacterium sp. TaxID=1964179 RepID=UPI0039E340AD
MRPLKALVPLALAFTLGLSAHAADQATDAKEADAFVKGTHTKVGDTSPAISVDELSGGTFNLAHEKGKVVVVNFWATWCGPCQVEMPRLEKEVWEKYKANPNFAMVAIAREQTKDVVAGFAAKHAAYTFPLAYDPQREVYKHFADVGIPRSYVIDRHGVIVFQSVGYTESDFLGLEAALDKALAAK